MYVKEQKVETVSQPTSTGYNYTTNKTYNYVHLYYPLGLLADEIEMHTATIGAHRSAEEAKHLLDLVTLTHDEFRQFASYARTAMSMVFPKISRFCKDIADCYKFDEQGDTPTQYDHSIHYTLRYGEELREAYVPALDQAVFDALKWYIIALWFHYVLPNTKDEEYYIQLAETSAEEAKKDASLAASGKGGVTYKTPRAF